MLAHCDNAAVVAVMNSRRSRDSRLMQMLRCLFFVEAHFQFKLTATHIPGLENDRADDLSRNNAVQFLSKSALSEPNPSIIPPLCCSGCSIQPWTGLVPAGPDCTVLLFAGNSVLNTKDLPVIAT